MRKGTLEVSDADVRAVLRHVTSDPAAVVDVIRAAKTSSGADEDRVRAALRRAIEDGSAFLHDDVTVSRPRWPVRSRKI